MMRREEVGMVLTYAVVTSALIAAVAASLMLAAYGPSEGFRALLIASSVAALAGLAYQVRRDLDAALMFLGGFGLSAAIFAGVYILTTDGGNRPVRIVAAGSAVLGAACLAWTTLRQRSTSEAYPDILGTLYPDRDAFEVGGVQFVHFLSPGRSRQPHRAVLALQNCHAGPRTVTVELDAEANAKYLRHPETVSIELGAAEVARVEIPVVSPTYEGRYELYFHPRISGPAAPRLRLRRRKAAPRRVQPWETLLLLFTYTLSYGGGTYFEIPPLGDDIWRHALPEVDRTTLWEPGDEVAETEDRYHRGAEGSYDR